MSKKTVKTRKTAKKSKVTTKPAKKASTKKVVKRTRKPAAPKQTVQAQPVVAPAAPAAPAVPAVPAVPVVPAKTEAEKIWDEIKSLPIQMFGLPNQVVAQHCTFVTVEPSQLYVTIRSTATLPSLEAAIAPAFVVELADKFVIVKRAPAVLAPAKR